MSEFDAGDSAILLSACGTLHSRWDTALGLARNGHRKLMAITIDELLCCSMIRRPKNHSPEYQTVQRLVSLDVQRSKTDALEEDLGKRTIHYVVPTFR